MTDDLEALRAETEAALAAAADLRAWDAVRVAALGKHGRLTRCSRRSARAPPDQRRERGAALNRLRDELRRRSKPAGPSSRTPSSTRGLASERIDVTLPPPPRPPG